MAQRSCAHFKYEVTGVNEELPVDIIGVKCLCVEYDQSGSSGNSLIQFRCNILYFKPNDNMIQVNILLLNVHVACKLGSSWSSDRSAIRENLSIVWTCRSQRWCYRTNSGKKHRNFVIVVNYYYFRHIANHALTTTPMLVRQSWWRWVQNGNVSPKALQCNKYELKPPIIVHMSYGDILYVYFEAIHLTSFLRWVWLLPGISGLPHPFQRAGQEVKRFASISHKSNTFLAVR